MEKAKRILNTIGIVFVVGSCAAYLLFAWSWSGWKALAIPTGSMRPAIPPGSLVLVRRVPVSSLKVGDVITHINPFDSKMTISHRIIKAYKLDGRIPAFVTKGDANKVADVPIVGGQVIGRVVWHAPYAGWALLDAKKPLVILPIVYFAGLLISIEEIQRLSSYYRLSQPYRARGFIPHAVKHPNQLKRRLAAGAALTVTLAAASGAVAPKALAALHSNTVTLANNQISVAPVVTPPQCSNSGNNKVTIINKTNQHGHSGNVNVSGNSGSIGNVSSGNVSNNNTTTITINQSNC